MNKQILLMLCLMSGLLGLMNAAESIGVFANNNTNCIQFIDPQTQTVSPSLLKGSLGSYGGGLFDVEITSDGKTAMVSNFGDSKIFFIDISGGFNAEPTLLGHVKIPFFAEDMALTPDDKYLLVTDGGFSSMIAIIDIATRKRHIENLGFKYANAVAITPDGKNVLTVDYFSNRIYLFKFHKEEDFKLYGDFALEYNLWLVFKYLILPTNLAIKGNTALVAGTQSAVASIALTSDGMTSTGYVLLPTKGCQSCVFSKDGTKAYCLSNSGPGRPIIHILNVTGPGQVSYSGISFPVRPRRGTSQLFGVDTIDIEPSGNYLYVSNPTVSGGVARISIIDLTLNMQVNYIQANGIPTGIKFAVQD